MRRQATCASPIPEPLRLEIEETSGSAAPVSQGGLATSTLRRCRAGFERGVLLGPLRLLRACHLTDHEFARGDLLANELKLRPTSVRFSLLSTPSHLRSLAGLVALKANGHAMP